MRTKHERPVHPGSLRDFARSVHWLGQDLPEGRWPCLPCRGRGSTCVPGQAYYDCTSCDGNGRGSKEALQKAYQGEIRIYHQEVIAWKREKKRYDRQEEIRRQALKKLTRKERQVLGV